jgi:hypothetical protein
MTDPTISIKFTTDTNDLQKGQQEALRSLSKTTDALKAQERALAQEVVALRSSSTASRADVQARSTQLRAVQSQIRENKQLTQALKEQKTTVDDTASSFKGLGGAVAGAVAGFSAVEVLKVADNYKLLEARLRVLTSATNDYSQVLATLERNSQANGSGFKDTLDLFAKLQPITKDLQATNQQTLQIVDTIQKLGAVSGIAGGELKEITTQLAQGFGGLSGDELKSLRERALPLLQPIVDELNRVGTFGKVAISDLKKLGSEGKITGDILARAFGNSDLIKKTNDQFFKLPTNLERSGQAFSDAFAKGLSNLDKVSQLTTTVAKGIDSITSALNKLNQGKGFDIFGDILSGVIEPQLNASRKSLGLPPVSLGTSEKPATAQRSKPVEPLKALSLTPVQQTVAKAANRYGVDPALLLGLVQQESSFRPGVISKDGGYGLGQFTGASIRRKYGLSRNADALNPEKNADATARYFRDLLEQYGGDEKAAIAAYNGGPNAVRTLRKTNYAINEKAPFLAYSNVTAKEVRNVLANASRFRNPGLKDVADATGQGGSSSLSELDGKDISGIRFQSDQSRLNSQIELGYKLEGQRKNELAQLRAIAEEKDKQVELTKTELQQLEALQTRSPKGEEDRKAQAQAKATELKQQELEAFKAARDLAEKTRELEIQRKANGLTQDEAQVRLSVERQAINPKQDEESKLNFEISAKTALLKIEQERLLLLKETGVFTPDDEAKVAQQQSEVERARLELARATIEAEKFNRDKRFKSLEDQQAAKLTGLKNRLGQSEFNSQLDNDTASQAVERIKSQLDRENQLVETAYDKRELTIEEYYSAQQDQIEQTYSAELQKLDVVKFGLLDNLAKAQELATATGETEDLNRVKTILAELLQIDEQRLDAAKDYNATVKSTARVAEQAVSGQKLDRLQAIGAALQQRGGLLGGIGTALNGGISGFRSGQFASGAFGLSANGLGAAVGGIGAVGGFLSQNSRPGGFGSILGGGLSGAALGAQIGSIIPGVGTVAGLLGGLGIGAASSLFGGGAAKRAAKREKEQAESYRRISKQVGRIADPLVRRPLDTISGLDETNSFLPELQGRLASANNLDDLLGARDRITALKPKGARAKQSRIQGVEAIQSLIADRINQQKQLQELIKQRAKDITSFTDGLKDQNRAIEEGLALSGASATERIALEQKQLLDGLKRDTEKALAQFKDSQTAQTEILRNEALKRKQIEQGLRDDYKASAQQLEELLKQRDSVSNSNVFQRATSVEQDKANQLAVIDKDIAAQFAAIKQFQALGIQAPDIASIGRITDAANKVTNAQLNVTINGATDTEATRQAIERAFNDFYRRIGASAA